MPELELGILAGLLGFAKACGAGSQESGVGERSESNALPPSALATQWPVLGCWSWGLGAREVSCLKLRFCAPLPKLPRSPLGSSNCVTFESRFLSAIPGGFAHWFDRQSVRVQHVTSIQAKQFKSRSAFEVPSQGNGGRIRDSGEEPSVRSLYVGSR